VKLQRFCKTCSISISVRGFKALKQTVKLHYKLGNQKEMMEAYREMLTYIKSAVTRNYSEKCINKILDFVSSSQNLELLQDFYQTTLQALEEAKNEVLELSLLRHCGNVGWDIILPPFFCFASSAVVMLSPIKTFVVTISKLNEREARMLHVRNYCPTNRSFWTSCG
jgi:hypothetical protein